MKRAESELQRAIEVRDEFLSIAGHLLTPAVAPLHVKLAAGHATMRRGHGKERPKLKLPPVFRSRK